MALTDGGDPDTASSEPTTPTAPATSGDDEAGGGADPVTAAPPQGETEPETGTEAGTVPPTEAPSGVGPDSEQGASPDVEAVEQFLDDCHRTAIADPAAAYDQAGPTLRSSITPGAFEAFWGRFDEVDISDVAVEDGRLVLDHDEFLEIIEPRG